MDTTGNPHLSVIIPAFNESSRIVPTLEEVVAYLNAQEYGWEVLVVDDGSEDGTADLVSGWSAGREGVRVIRRDHFGKGWAVRAGMLEAKGAYRFMCDADLATPIGWLDLFLERMEAGNDIVIGSRDAEGSRRFDEPIHRRVMGRVFNRVVRLIAVSGFQDTQCGFKCFRGEAASELFGLQRARGMGFDVEILYLAVKRGFRVSELPVDWRHQAISKVRLGADTLDMVKDTVLVRARDVLGMYR